MKSTAAKNKISNGTEIFPNASCRKVTTIKVFAATNRKNILKEYVDFSDGKINYKDFFSRYKFTHIIITNDKPFLFDELSSDKNFRVLYESEQAVGSEVIRCKIFKKD